jgi:hypothetical protein
VIGALIGFCYNGVWYVYAFSQTLMAEQTAAGGDMYALVNAAAAADGEVLQQECKFTIRQQPSNTRCAGLSEKGCIYT